MGLDMVVVFLKQSAKLQLLFDMGKFYAVKKPKSTKKVRALTIFGQSKADNQRFKCAKLLTVRRCMHDVYEKYARK